MKRQGNDIIKTIKKFLATLALSVLLAIQIGPAMTLSIPTAYAEDVTTSTNTVLPEAKVDCNTYDKYQNMITKFDRKRSDYEPQHRVDAKNDFQGYSRDEQYQVIACSLKSGRFHLFMAPYMIRYFLEFIIGLAGLICTLFIVIGAYQYMIGSVTENKQKGKETIKNALIGLVITLLAWVIVNVVQVAITGGGV